MSDFIDLCSGDDSDRSPMSLGKKRNMVPNNSEHELAEEYIVGSARKFMAKRQKHTVSHTPIDLTYSDGKSLPPRTVDKSIISIHSTQSANKLIVANKLSFHSQEEAEEKEEPTNSVPADQSFIELVDSPFKTFFDTYAHSQQSLCSSPQSQDNDIDFSNEIQESINIQESSYQHMFSQSNATATKTCSVFALLSSKVIKQQNTHIHNNSSSDINNNYNSSGNSVYFRESDSVNHLTRETTQATFSSESRTSLNEENDVENDAVSSKKKPSTLVSRRKKPSQSTIISDTVVDSTIETLSAIDNHNHNNSIANSAFETNNNKTPDIRNNNHVDDESATATYLVPLPNAGAEYEIRLLVDRRERANNLVLASLQTLGVRCEPANLAVGDFLFVARRKVHGLYNNTESETVAQDTLVIDQVVVERKAIADLASSLLDGRFSDQKRRLKLTQIKRCVVLVEGENLLLPPQMAKILTAQHLKTAMVNAFADHNVHIVRTRNMDHSIAFLRTLYRQVSHTFFTQLKQPENTTNSSVYYDGDNRDFSKKFMSLKHFQSQYRARSADNLSELFGQQLRQIQGCGASATHAIVSRYGTLAHFMWHMRSMGRLNALRELEDLHRRDEACAASSSLHSTHHKNNQTKYHSRLGSVLAKRILSVILDEY